MHGKRSEMNQIVTKFDAISVAKITTSPLMIVLLSPLDVWVSQFADVDDPFVMSIFFG